MSERIFVSKAVFARKRRHHTASKTCLSGDLTPQGRTCWQLVGVKSCYLICLFLSGMHCNGADRAVHELNEAFKQSGLVNFLNTVSLVSEILRIFGLVNVICLPISFQTGPLGLTRLVQRFTRKQDETAEQARKQFFRRIFGILWVRFLCCFYCMPCNFMTKTYNSAFNLPLFVDTWLWALFAALAWHVWRVLQLGIHLLCDYFCATFHCKWPFTRYIFWWSLGDPLTIFDYYTRVYTKQFVVQDTPRLSSVVVRTVLFLERSIKVWSFFDSRFVDYFSMSVPMHYPGFLSLLSISYPSTLFSSTVWKQSGGGPISRKGRADVRIPRVYQGSDTCSGIARLEGFSQSRNSHGKTCTIFENPYPTALATSFSNHRIFAFRWNIWNPFVSCYFKYCICSRCLYSHCIRVCVENFQVYKVTMSDLYQVKWPGDNWSDNSNDYFDFFYL